MIKPMQPTHLLTKYAENLREREAMTEQTHTPAIETVTPGAPTFSESLRGFAAFIRSGAFAMDDVEIVATKLSAAAALTDGQDATLAAAETTIRELASAVEGLDQENATLKARVEAAEYVILGLLTTAPTEAAINAGQEWIGGRAG